MPTVAAVPQVLGDTGAAGQWTTLARFAHASDLHITDTESPARLDFMADHADDPRYEQPLPTIRPQQLTATHAAAATLQTIDRMAETERLDCAILSGDLLDNGQYNELTRLLRMLDGGEVSTSASTGTSEGSQSSQWTNSKLWRPGDVRNFWTEHYGFPSGPEILEAIRQPLNVAPFVLPVLLARGNHDALLAGSVAWTPFLSRLAVGAHKTRTLSPAFPLTALKTRFRADPDAFFAGDTIAVTPDDSRRPVGDGEFPLALGIATQHARGNDYVVRLNTRVAFVVLDTLYTHGHPSGVVSTAQATWLHEVLAELDDDDERPVVAIVSHHGVSHHHVTSPSDGRLTGPELVALLGKHPSVAVWLTGHTHVASTTLHKPRGHRGIWEITAPSIIDWPCQFQSVELSANPDGAVKVVVKQHDYDATTPCREDDLTNDLAGFHRLLAANQADFGRIFPGTHGPAGGDCVLHLRRRRDLS